MEDIEEKQFSVSSDEDHMIHLNLKDYDEISEELNSDSDSSSTEEDENSSESDTSGEDSAENSSESSSDGNNSESDDGNGSDSNSDSENEQAIGGVEAGSEAVVGTDKPAEIVRTAVGSASGGTTVIPVYIGKEKIDEIVVRAARPQNFRSGGR